MSMNDELIEQIADWVFASKNTIAFTGAGISTESGVPDFRSPGGVWAKNDPVYYQDFLASADSRYEYWRQKAESHVDFAKAKPNDGHLTLASWEQTGRLHAVVTQNIDGIHQLAGSKNVWELHGTAREIACLDCDAWFDADEMVEKFLAEKAVPDCPSCGGMLKHATISFGQAMPMRVMTHCIGLAEQCELCFAIGSSLVVEPAASIPRIAKNEGAKIVIINRDPTPLDSIADAVIHESIGATFRAIAQILTTKLENGQSS